MLRKWARAAGHVIQNLSQSVLRKTIVFEPYCEEDEKPTPDAIERSKLVSTPALRKMEPDSRNDGKRLRRYDQRHSRRMVPRLRGFRDRLEHDRRQASRHDHSPPADFVLGRSVQYYAFDTYKHNRSLLARNAKARAARSLHLRIRPCNITQREKLIPFPENKFLVGICKSKAGSPAGRRDAGFRSRGGGVRRTSQAIGLLNLAQVFGLAISMGKLRRQHAPQATIDRTPFATCCRTWVAQVGRLSLPLEQRSK